MPKKYQGCTLASSMVWMVLAVSLGFVVTLLSFYPGLMSADSFSQLEQARNHHYYAQHPPIMSLLWGIFDPIWPGPQSILFLHSLFYWGALGALFSTFRNRIAGAIITLAIGLFPPNFLIVGTIWKDIGMGATLLASFTLLFFARERRDLRLAAAALPVLFYATAVRHEAFIAVLPLVFYGCATMLETSWARAVGLALIVWLSLIGLNKTMSHFVVDPNGDHNVAATAAFDIIGISVAKGQNLLPGELASIPIEHFRERISYCSCFILFFGPGAPLPVYTTSLHEKELLDAWFQVVRREPLAYLKLRWNMLLGALGLLNCNVYTFHFAGIDNNRLGVEFVRPPLFDRASRLAEMLYTTTLFKPWVYLCVSSLFCFLSFVMRRPFRYESLVLFASGALHFGLFALVSGGLEYRYTWWLVLSSTVNVGLFCLAGRLTPEPSQEAAPGQDDGRRLAVSD